MQQFTPGTMLQNGKYRIGSVIGQGFFGSTYIGEHTMFQRKVAIKEYRPQSNADVFIQAAITLSRIQHPGLTSIIDVFKEFGKVFLVTDWIEGQTLEKAAESGLTDSARAIKHICRVADTIDQFHQNGINHLDIKPSNIIIRQTDDTPVLIEYGIDKNLGYNDPAFKGSPAEANRGYTPLEQYSTAITSFSPETDIYSLSATLYKLLTHVTPPEPTAILASGGLDFPESVPQSIRDVITKGMSIAIAGRFHTIGDFTDALRQAQAAQCPPPVPAAKNIPSAIPSIPVNPPAVEAEQAPDAPVPPVSAFPATSDSSSQPPVFDRPPIPTPETLPHLPESNEPKMPEMPPFIEPHTASATDVFSSPTDSGLNNFEMDLDMPEFIEPSPSGSESSEPVIPNMAKPGRATSLSEPSVTPQPEAAAISNQTLAATEIEMPPFTMDSDGTVEPDTDLNSEYDETISIEGYDEPESEPDHAKSPRRSNKRGALILGGLILLVVLAVAAIFYFQTTGANNNNASSATPIDSTDTHSSQPSPHAPESITVTDHEMNLFGDACTYTGPLNADSIPDGHGSLNYKATDFESYTGDFVNGKFEGEGQLISRNGNLLTGTFRNGLLVDGTYKIKKTGSYYTGTFINGEAYDGVWYDSKGNQTGTVSAGRYSRTK